VAPPRADLPEADAHTPAVKRQLGRPPVGPKVMANVDQQTVDALGELANEERLTYAALIRDVLTTWVASTEAPAGIARLGPGSVIRCECGCNTVSVRAQDGEWVHAQDIAIGEPGCSEDLKWRGETHKVFHRSSTPPVSPSSSTVAPWHRWSPPTARGAVRAPPGTARTGPV